MELEIKSLRVLVRVLWDSNENVWLATSEEVPGLVVEATTFDEIVSEVRRLAPELLALNTGSTSKVLDLHFLADRLEFVAA